MTWCVGWRPISLQILFAVCLLANDIPATVTEAQKTDEEIMPTPEPPFRGFWKHLRLDLDIKDPREKIKNKKSS